MAPTLPDDTYRRAAYLARLTGRDIADILAETIDRSLYPLGAQPLIDRPVAHLSDEDVQAVADGLMDSTHERQLSELLAKQQGGRMTDEDRTDLLALLQMYQDGLLRKAQALHEAVRRGLRSPLAP